MIDKICENCGKDFRVKKYREKTARFCSKPCHLHRNLRQVSCSGCAKKFVTSPSRTKKKWCSQECRTISAMTLRERRRQNRQIRQASGRRGMRHSKNRIIIQRSASCEVCHKSFLGIEYVLDLHHIDKNLLNNSDENFALVCCICHRKIHKGDAVCPSKKVLQDQLFLPILEK